MKPLLQRLQQAQMHNQASKKSMLHTLPKDALISCLSYLQVHHILPLTAVCKQLDATIHDAACWKTLLFAHFKIQTPKSQARKKYMLQLVLSFENFGYGYNLVNANLTTHHSVVRAKFTQSPTHTILLLLPCE